MQANNRTIRASASRLLWPLRKKAVVAAVAAVLHTATAQAQDANQNQAPDLIFDLPAEQISLAMRSPIALPTADELEDVAIDPALRALVLRLEDPSFAVREEATRTLIESQPDKLQLYAMLAPTSDLSVEQRYRLLTVLRESLVRTPRGALGISMQPLNRHIGGPIEIRVTDLVPGLPAERILQVNDRIAKVDHQVMLTTNDLLMRVQSKRPGEKVALTVLRPQINDQGQPIVDINNEPAVDVLEIELELGSADLLREFNEQNLANQQFGQIAVSPVESMRLAEAENAMRKLAPTARPIVVGGNPRLIAIDARPKAGQEGDLALDPDVEQHPAVLRILFDRQQIKQGKVSPEELQLLANQWQLQLLDLFRQSQNPKLTHDQAEYLRLVMDRFAELMQP